MGLKNTQYIISNYEKIQIIQLNFIEFFITIITESNANTGILFNFFSYCFGSI